MTFAEIANELVAGCRAGRKRTNLDTLYAPDAVSVEAMEMSGGRKSRGMAAIHGKHEAQPGPGNRLCHVKGGKIVREEFFWSA